MELTIVMTSTAPQRRLSARRGSAYLFVLVIALVVTVIGMGTLAVARTQLRQATDIRDEQAARSLAFAAAEHALLAVDTTANWRTALESQTVQKALDGGTLSWQLTDPNDGDLDNSSADPVRLTATGQRGLARYALAFDLTPAGGGGPLSPADRTLCFGTTQISNQGDVTLDGGNLASDQAVTNAGTIDGNVQAPSVGGTGTITGTISNAPLANNPPTQAVIDSWIAKATTIPSANKLEKTVLAPGYNPFGSPNADGVYYMQAASTVQVSNLRVCGTLIIDVGSHTVNINGPVLLEHARGDYPALIIIGDLDINYTGGAGALQEGNKWNFNPAGAPYNSQTDGDKNDSYPAFIRGMVHVTGDASIDGDSDLYGLLLTNGNVSITGTVRIHADADTQGTPPAGYFGEYTGVSPTGCARVVN